MYNSCTVVNNFIKTMDSIATSCIQLAKEQIIKYSDPKYNINDLKTGDCETMLLDQTIYYLNKSKSKWISVGLYYPFEFASVVKIFGRSKQYVIFKEEEWIQFHEQRENINKYFQTFDTMWKPRYRLSYSSGSNFIYFYEDVIRAVAEMSGDVKINIYNIINRLSEKSDDVCCMLGVLLFMPKKELFDVQLERRIQEQGVAPNLMSVSAPKDGNFSKYASRFNGNKGSGVVALIDAIEVYKDCTNISDANALRALSMLLDGFVVSWWQGVKDSESWTGALDLLRLTFGPKKLPHRVYVELFYQEQDSKTPTDVFVCKCRQTLAHLPKDTLNETIQLDIIYGLLNIQIRE
ncbi:hypothetical protein FQA39_LY15497 [Lamprigera yunnana]|nr:hypothetical protein FQA39_LY15497 [Lamprigera yunnana]